MAITAGSSLVGGCKQQADSSTTLSDPLDELGICEVFSPDLPLSPGVFSVEREALSAT